MTYTEVKAMLQEAGVPVSYEQFTPTTGGTQGDYISDEQSSLITNHTWDPINLAPMPGYDGPPAPPFLCFFFPGIDDFMADNANYVTIRPLTVELYTEEKDFTLEATLEGVFRSHSLPFSRTETYIPDERMFQITYSLEVLINA